MEAAEARCGIEHRHARSYDCKNKGSMVAFAHNTKLTALTNCTIQVWQESSGLRDCDDGSIRAVPPCYASIPPPNTHTLEHRETCSMRTGGTGHVPVRHTLICEHAHNRAHKPAHQAKCQQQRKHKLRSAVQGEGKLVVIQLKGAVK